MDVVSKATFVEFTLISDFAIRVIQAMLSLGQSREHEICLGMSRYEITPGHPERSTTMEGGCFRVALCYMMHEAYERRLQRVISDDRVTFNTVEVFRYLLSLSSSRCSGTVPPTMLRRAMLRN